VTTALAAGCGVLGLVAGLKIPVWVERVPDKRSLLTSPFPEVRRWLARPVGWIVIVGTGALFSAMALRLGETWELPAFLLLAFSLVVLSIIDLRLYLLPNRILFPLAGASVVLLGLAALADGDLDPFARALVCAVASFAAFTALHLVSPRAMGFGDVKLAFVLGLYLGWLGAGEAVLGFVLGFVYGAAVGVVLLATGARGRKDHVPFGPFLAAGALTAILVGDVILEWYRG
jgi:leader peptidase (prepilin peptidase)/N-methyltransferase